MAITYPISISQFWGALKASQIEFSLGESMSTAETGGGEILTARRGSRLWSGSIDIVPAYSDDQDEAIALADLIRQSGASFMIYDLKRAFPKTDPKGVVASANTCTISSIAGNRRDVTLTGMPSGYVLTRGDMIQITYGASPTRFYLGRLVKGATFTTSAVVEVVPPLPPAIAASDVVTLVRPACKAVYVPGSFRGPMRTSGPDSGFSFGWRQTLR